MALLTYNGHSLPFQVTDDADERVVLSEDGSDYLYTKKSYTISSILNPSLAPAGLTFPQWIDRLQHDLEQLRRPLRVDFGGGTLVEADETTDCNNGPTPEHVRFHRFAGSDTCVLTFRVTCHVQACPGGQVLSNRWAERVEIHPDTFLTRRVRTGKLVIRPGQLVADDFRYLVTPPAPVGFRQGVSSYEVQSNGLALTYTIPHEELAVGIPPGATKAVGDTRVTAEKGIWKYAEVSLTLTGDKAQSKQALLELAILVAMERLDRFGRLKDAKTGKWQLLSGSVGEKLYENQVTVTLRTLLAQPRKPKKAASGRLKLPITSALGFVAALREAFAASDDKPGDDPRDPAKGMPVPKQFDPTSYAAKPLGSEPELSPDFGLRSTAGLKLVAAAMNDPCLAELVRGGQDNELVGFRRFGSTATAPAADTVRLPRGVAARTSTLVGAPIPVANVTVVDRITDPFAQGEEYPAGGVYTDYRLHLEVRERQNKAELPEQRLNGEVKFVSLSTPTIRLIVRWQAERVGEPPEVPSQDLGDPNAVFLEGDYSPGTAEVAEDGVTMIFASSGVYTYGFKNPRLAKISAGMPPWVAELVGVGTRPIVYAGPPGVDAGSLILAPSQLVGIPPS